MRSQTTKWFVLFLFLLAAPPAFSNPLKRVAHAVTTHKRFWIMEGAAIAGATVHAVGLRHCRRGDVEQCDEKYGQAWAWYGFISGYSLIAQPAIAEGCWKENPDAKFCRLFAHSATAYQFSQGVLDFRAYRPKSADDK